MGRKEESAKALSTAFNKASAIQLYTYARGLQRSGNAKRAFELYPQVPKKDANHWISHLALARISSNTGDFPTAAKEMTQAISGAPDTTKPFLEPLLKRLEAKDDINK
jgi:tetratricopeptide (TPR) repeat protein